MPEPPEKYPLDSESKEVLLEAGTSAREDQDFSAYPTLERHLITPVDLNNLLEDLDLPETKAHLLGSMLQQWKVLEEGVKVSLYRKRQVNTARYFSVDDELVYCHVCGLMEDLQLQHAADQWRLIIDSSKIV